MLLTLYGHICWTQTNVFCLFILRKDILTRKKIEQEEQKDQKREKRIELKQTEQR